MSALRELIASFGIDVDDKALKRGHEQVEGLKETLLKLGEALGVAFGLHEIKEFVQGTIEAGARVSDLSDRLGVGAGDLQAFQFAAGLAGVDAEGAAHSLGLLNRTIGEAILGGGEAAQTFARLGIGLKGPSGAARDVNDVLLDVAGAFEKLPDHQTRAAYAMKLFGREGQALIPVLGKGREELAATLAEFRELGGGMSDDFVKQAKEVDDESKKLNLSWTGLKTTIVGALLPYLRPIVDWFKRIVSGATELAKHTRALRTAFQFATAGAVIVGLLKIAGALKAIFVNGLLAEAPIAVMAVAAAALYLAFDELYTLLNGGDTLIGDALGPDKEKFVADLRGSVDTLTQAFADLGTLLGGDGTGMGAFTTIVVDLAKALAWVFEALTTVAKALGWVIEKVGTAGLGIAHFFGATTGSERQILGGDRANAGLTEEARKRLGDIGVGAQDFAPISALGRKQTTRTTSDDTIRNQYNAAVAGFTGPLLPSGQWQGPTLPPSIVPRSFSGPLDLGEKRGNVIHQQVTNKVEVHTKDEPQAIGDAVASSLATPLQRANERAYRAVTKP